MCHFLLIMDMHVDGKKKKKKKPSKDFEGMCKERFSVNFIYHTNHVLTGRVIHSRVFSCYISLLNTIYIYMQKEQ